MSKKISLIELQKALEQPNSAIRKHALALIFNESIVEAKPLLEDYLGRENNAQLQALTLQVLKKLQNFSKFSGQVEVEKLESFLSHPDLERRLLGLRGLIGRKSKKIPPLIDRFCTHEKNTEALVLISEILKSNPDMKNLSFLEQFASSKNENLRINALDGYMNIISGAILPVILKSLDDPSPVVKMRAFQLAGKVDRRWLTESLDTMLKSDSLEENRTAANLLHVFIGEDLLTTISTHFNHRDSETAELCRHALYILSKRGCSEAGVLIEQLGKENKPQVESISLEILSPGLNSLVKALPFSVAGILRAEKLQNDPVLVLYRVKECYLKICKLLACSFIAYYFAFGKKSQQLNYICFRSLSDGINKVDVIKLISELAPVFPEPENEGDLFPAVIARNVTKDVEENLFGEIISLKEGFSFLEQHPEMADSLLQPALADMEKLVGHIECIKSNSLLIKCASGDQIRFINFWKPAPEFVDPRQLESLGFDVQINRPILISKNSSRFLDMFPFMSYDNEKKLEIGNNPGEQELWEFLVKNNILEQFMVFLTEKVR
ncbi:MAG: HEAT repeat domain-containing protein [Candidatus Riflebacteria bacterium]|nr:HEAT repeat domain-containing protein [Candidatus Riflebacteria bacterium]